MRTREGTLNTAARQDPELAARPFEGMAKEAVFDALPDELAESMLSDYMNQVFV